MTSGLSRWVMAAAVVAGVVALATAPAVAPRAAAAPQDPADPVVPKEGEAAKYDTTACRTCHYKAPEAVKDDAFSKDFQSNEFVLLTEGNTWTQQDPHSRAYAVLQPGADGKPGLGQQMSKLLGYDVTKAPQCLTCHAIDTAPTKPLAEKTFADHFAVDEGITCNACHGLRRPWQINHYDPNKKFIPWRVYAPEKKEKDGLRNLRDPGVRAAFCATCHVGSAAEGKVVTHEMYAAGHPPLPPFELGTFMDCQPKHWGAPVYSSLAYFEGDNAAKFAARGNQKLPENWQWELYRFHPTDKEVFVARSVAAGAIASLQSEMRMLAADAATVAVNPKADGIDYARFDCYACHHNLVVPSDRQKRGYDGKPGRPPMKAWLAALPGVVADHADSLPPLAGAGKAFQSKWAAVRTAALSRPFGDPAAVKVAAEDMAKWCDDFLAKSANGGRPLYTKAESERLLATIGAAATSDKWTADPEAAMHLTWAYLSLRPGVGGPPDPAALEALGKTVPVRVRALPYSDAKMLPVPAGVAIGPRLDLFGRFKAADFTARFNAVMKK